MKIGAYLAAAFAIVVWSVTFASTRALLRDFSAYEILIVRFVMAWVALWGVTEFGSHALDGVFSVSLATTANVRRFSAFSNWANFVFLGLIASAASFAMWNFACKAIGMVKATVGLYFTPIVGVAFAVLFLGEPLTVSGISGGALILIGVFIANRNKARLGQ